MDLKMYRVVHNKEIAPATHAIKVDASKVASKARARQFVSMRVDENGRQIPLTIVGNYPDDGQIKIFQEIR